MISVKPKSGNFTISSKPCCGFFIKFVPKQIVFKFWLLSNDLVASSPSLCSSLLFRIIYSCPSTLHIFSDQWFCSSGFLPLEIAAIQPCFLAPKLQLPNFSIRVIFPLYSWVPLLPAALRYSFTSLTVFIPLYSTHLHVHLSSSLNCDLIKNGKMYFIFLFLPQAARVIGTHNRQAAKFFLSFFNIWMDIFHYLCFPLKLNFTCKYFFFQRLLLRHRLQTKHSFQILTWK